ncbi:hypothetical protein QR721_11255 [Aciduricibacillus chroicocephali]|uniref:Uncharacterized protein n=1 Tax=Aciduricibacillus chroicocephali TaxID=3054939 RepID=A0ABY9KTZ5_9BACI|nr:hypothetical protein QR721_11255 [Bacillaceae bacterium 44XB]
MLFLKAFLGIALILWGIFILFSVLFKMKNPDYKDDGTIGTSGFIELELVSKTFNRLPAGLAKGIVIVTGISFVVLGIVMI